MLHLFGSLETLPIKPHVNFASRMLFSLRVNITIVYEHTVCATSAFGMCTLRVAFNVVLLISQ